MFFVCIFLCPYLTLRNFKHYITYIFLINKVMLLFFVTEHFITLSERELLKVNLQRCNVFISLAQAYLAFKKPTFSDHLLIKIPSSLENKAKRRAYCLKKNGHLKLT